MTQRTENDEVRTIAQMKLEEEVSFTMVVEIFAQ